MHAGIWQLKANQTTITRNVSGRRKKSWHYRKLVCIILNSSTAAYVGAHASLLLHAHGIFSFETIAEAAEVADILAKFGLLPDEYRPVVAALRKRPEAWLEFMMRSPSVPVYVIDEQSYGTLPFELTTDILPFF